jgi:hypothetical protein
VWPENKKESKEKLKLGRLKKTNFSQAMEAQVVSHFKELDSCRMTLSRVDDFVEDTQISLTVNGHKQAFRKS